MLEKTKAAAAAEVMKGTICIDPAPKPGDGIMRVVKAFAEDVKEMMNKKTFVK